MQQKRVLFILKRRQDFNSEKHTKIGLTTGLYNSADYMNQMLIEAGITSKLVVVVDNNDIDREVNKFNPTHVIIEALWVVPTKFTVLCDLHPKVKWIIRLHSEVPFLANEGVAFDWIGDYSAFPNLIVAANAPRALEEIRFYLKTKAGWDDETTKERVIYLPNYYPQEYKKKAFAKDKNVVDVGCFGAVRPMKNHMIQAIAAIKFADKIGKKLRFHINVGRIEQKGDPVLNNLRSLFTQLYKQGHRLIAHEWAPREEFLKVCEKVDIGMQVSFSETFNIVAADLLSQGVPVVGSNEIPWMLKFYTASVTESDEMYRKLLATYYAPGINVYMNQRRLYNYTNKAKSIWIDYFKP